MKKTLVKLGVLVVTLAVAAFVTTRDEAPPAPKALTVAGYASATELAAEKTRGVLEGPADIAYPIDEILISRDGQTLHLVRAGEGKDAQWNLTAPMDAVAVKYRVEKMIKLFKDKTSSVHTKAIQSSDHPLFDFEAERRIGVTLKAGGAVWNGVDFVIGRVEESESQATQGGVAKDTWVLASGDEGTAYRIGGKDLRADFEVPLSDLRDKKLFSIKGDDLVHIEAVAPGGAKVVLDGTRTESPAAEEGKPPKVTVAWTMTEPTGYETDDSAKTFARNVAGARTKAFLTKDEGPEGGLGDATWHITARTHDGKTIGLELAADGDPAWAQVDGRDEWAQVESYTAKNLRKSLADLRSKTLWSLPEGDLTAVTFGAEEGKPTRVSKGKDGWTIGGKAPADMSGQLRHLSTAKAKRYANTAEAAAASAALTGPAFTARIEAGDKVVVLTASAEMTEGDLKGNRWARVTIDGQVGEPVLLPGFTAKRFLKTASDLQRKTFFDLTRDGVQRLDVTHPDGTKVALERSAASGQLELLELPDGKATKQAAVGTMVGTLPKLKAKTFEPTTKPKAAGLVPGAAYRVDVTGQDGAKHTLLVSTQTSGQDPYAMALTGPLANQVATINNFQALNLQKKSGELSE